MHMRLVAPDMDLLQAPEPPAAKPVPPPADVLKQLMKLRDEMTQSASNGRFHDAAAREWRGLPVMWRVAACRSAASRCWVMRWPLAAR